MNFWSEEFSKISKQMTKESCMVKIIVVIKDKIGENNIT